MASDPIIKNARVVNGEDGKLYLHYDLDMDLLKIRYAPDLAIAEWQALPWYKRLWYLVVSAW